jgi:hypothetical protein
MLSVRNCRFLALLPAVLLLVARPCPAQTPVSLHFDSVFFGDNTEFMTPFRSGETILGSNQRLLFELKPGERVALRFGVYALERAGSRSAVDKALPIVALQIGTGRQRFILGTLESTKRSGIGPDRTTPHGLLPPLALETLWFERAYEAGLQWLVDTPRYRHDLWFDYQHVNGPGNREKFDAGMVGRARVAGPVAFAYQFHVVHHGGQQFDDGPVADSFGMGPGVIVEGPVGKLESASIELYGLAAYDRPDRATPSLTVKGKGAFLRIAAEHRHWRAHALAWRGDNFNHEDGDGNYLSRFENGVRFRKIRDYSEAGLARLFQPAPGVDVEASVRIHRIEPNYTYSYRVLATIHLELWETTIPPRR